METTICQQYYTASDNSQQYYAAPDNSVARNSRPQIVQPTSEPHTDAIERRSPRRKYSRSPRRKYSEYRTSSPRIHDKGSRKRLRSPSVERLRYMSPTHYSARSPEYCHHRNRNSRRSRSSSPFPPSYRRTASKSPIRHVRREQCRSRSRSSSRYQTYRIESPPGVRHQHLDRHAYSKPSRRSSPDSDSSGPPGCRKQREDPPYLHERDFGYHSREDYHLQSYGHVSQQETLPRAIQNFERSHQQNDRRFYQEHPLDGYTVTQQRLSVKHRLGVEGNPYAVTPNQRFIQQRFQTPTATVTSFQRQISYQQSFDSEMNVPRFEKNPQANEFVHPRFEEPNQKKIKDSVEEPNSRLESMSSEPRSKPCREKITGAQRDTNIIPISATKPEKSGKPHQIDSNVRTVESSWTSKKWLRAVEPPNQVAQPKQKINEIVAPISRDSAEITNSRNKISTSNVIGKVKILTEKKLSEKPEELVKSLEAALGHENFMRIKSALIQQAIPPEADKTETEVVLMKNEATTSKPEMETKASNHAKKDSLFAKKSTSNKLRPQQIVKINKVVSSRESSAEPTMQVTKSKAENPTSSKQHRLPILSKFMKMKVVSSQETSEKPAMQVTKSKPERSTTSKPHHLPIVSKSKPKGMNNKVVSIGEISEETPMKVTISKPEKSTSSKSKQSQIDFKIKNKKVVPSWTSEEPTIQVTKPKPAINKTVTPKAKLTELDRLHSHINDMYDREGISHLSGPRACTLQKKNKIDDSNELDYSQLDYELMAAKYDLKPCGLVLTRVNLNSGVRSVKIDEVFVASNPHLEEMLAPYLDDANDEATENDLEDDEPPPKKPSQEQEREVFQKINTTPKLAQEKTVEKMNEPTQPAPKRKNDEPEEKQPSGEPSRKSRRRLFWSRGIINKRHRQRLHIRSENDWHDIEQPKKKAKRALLKFKLKQIADFMRFVENQEKKKACVMETIELPDKGVANSSLAETGELASSSKVINLKDLNYLRQFQEPGRDPVHYNSGSVKSSNEMAYQKQAKESQESTENIRPTLRVIIHPGDKLSVKKSSFQESSKTLPVIKASSQETLSKPVLLPVPGSIAKPLVGKVIPNTSHQIESMKERFKSLDSDDSCSTTSAANISSITKVLIASTAEIVKQEHIVIKDILRPWIKGGTNRKRNFVSRKMLGDYNCLAALYKCMGSSCSFFTSSKVLFHKHLDYHQNDPNSDQNFKFCAYCKFSTDTSSELVAHIELTHGYDRFQCAYCFYRAYSDFYVFHHHHNAHHIPLEKTIIQCEDFEKRTPINTPIKKFISTNVPPLKCFRK